MHISKHIILSLMLLSSASTVKPNELSKATYDNTNTILKEISYIRRNMPRRFSAVKSTTLLGLIVSWPFLFKKSYPTVWEEIKENVQTAFSTVSEIVSKKTKTESKNSN